MNHFGRQALRLLFALVLWSTSGAGFTQAVGTSVVTLPIRFEVVNQNRSQLPCFGDRQTYEVRGRLVMPGLVGGAPPSAVTLYLHGFGFGENFWRFRDVSGFDFAAGMARRGHASVVIDRLGYDASAHPPGRRVCIGSHADVAAQIVRKLKAGDYQLRNRSPIRFSAVALAGHSSGAVVAEVAAYSFGGIDALITMAWADQPPSPKAVSTAVLPALLLCGLGGEPAEPALPGGYAYFGQTGADFQALMFNDAEPAVIEAATARRNRDPCGDFASVTPATVLDQILLRRIEVPVLIVCGGADAIFPRQACEGQRNLFGGAADLTVESIQDAGHALTLERSAPTLRLTVSNWLTQRGF